MMRTLPLVRPRSTFLIVLALLLGSPVSAVTLLDSDLEEDLGVWSQDPAGDLDWTRDPGSTPSSGAGYASDTEIDDVLVEATAAPPSQLFCHLRFLHGGQR